VSYFVPVYCAFSKCSSIFLGSGATFEAVSLGVEGAAGSTTSRTSQTTKSEEEHILLGLNDIPLAKISISQYDLKLTEECEKAVKSILANPSYDEIIRFNDAYGMTDTPACQYEFWLIPKYAHQVHYLSPK
jgi:hypothetical protein